MKVRYERMKTYGCSCGQTPTTPATGPILLKPEGCKGHIRQSSRCHSSVWRQRKCWHRFLGCLMFSGNNNREETSSICHYAAVTHWAAVQQFSSSGHPDLFLPAAQEMSPLTRRRDGRWRQQQGGQQAAERKINDIVEMRQLEEEEMKGIICYLQLWGGNEIQMCCR